MAYVPPHKRSLKERQGGNDRGQSQGRPWPNAKTRGSSPKENNDRSAYDSSAKLLPVFDQVTFYRCINLSERPDKWRAFQKRAANVHSSFAKLVKRFDAVNGKQILNENQCNETYVQLVWDSSLNAKYSPKISPGSKTMTAGEVGCALSHVELWKTLASAETLRENAIMMVLEDDAVFSMAGGKTRFANVLTQAMEILPSDWGILYLGLSDRGQRQYIEETETTNSNREILESNCKVELYRPEYGYHTHAYMITQQAALTLLRNLPVQGPIDVWMADNKWFDLSVYSAVIANEGWKREDGVFEGAVLVSQDRGLRSRSDVRQSSSYSSKGPMDEQTR